MGPLIILSSAHVAQSRIDVHVLICYIGDKTWTQFWTGLPCENLSYGCTELISVSRHKHQPAPSWGRGRGHPSKKIANSHSLSARGGGGGGGQCRRAPASKVCVALSTAWVRPGRQPVCSPPPPAEVFGMCQAS